MWGFQKGAGHHTFHRCAAGNAPDSRHIDHKRGLIGPLDAQATHNQIALGDCIGFTIGAQKGAH